MKHPFSRVLTPLALCLLLVLGLTLSACSKDDTVLNGDPAVPSVPSDNELYPATLQELTDHLGNAAVARAVTALYGLPSTRFSVDITMDYHDDSGLIHGLCFEELAGELQYGPFAMHDTFRYRSSNTVSASTVAGDETLSAFGTGEMSALYYTGTTERKYDPDSDPVLCSGMLLREPGVNPYGQYFPGGDFCSDRGYVPAKGSTVNYPLATQLHGLLTCILNGGTDFTETERGEINGKTAVCYTGRYSKETLACLTQELYCPVSLELYEEDPALDHGVAVRFWIDVATGLPLRVESDLTELEKDLLESNYVADRIVRELQSKPGNTKTFEELKQELNLLLEIREASFRLELEPRSERVSLPAELPEESERRILEEGWTVISTGYANLAEAKNYTTIPLTTDDSLLTPYLSSAIESAAASGNPAAVISAEKKPAADTPLYLAVWADAYTVLLREAGEPVCRVGNFPVATYMNRRLTYTGEAMPAGFAEAADEAIRAASGTAVDFEYNGTLYHAERANKLEWEISTGGLEYVAENPGEGFEAALLTIEEAGVPCFDWNGRTFACGPQIDGVVSWFAADRGGSPVLFATRLNLYFTDPDQENPGLLTDALTAISAGAERFSASDGSGSFALERAQDGWRILDADGFDYALLLSWRAVRSDGYALPLKDFLPLVDAARTLRDGSERRLTVLLRIPEISEPDPNNPDRPCLDPTSALIVKKQLGGDTYYDVSVKMYAFMVDVEIPAHGEPESPDLSWGNDTDNPAQQDGGEG